MSIFILILLSSPCFISCALSEHSIIEHVACPLRISEHLNWWYQLRQKSYPQKCLQIIHSKNPTEIPDSCFMQQLVSLNFSFYVRSLSNVTSVKLDNTKPATRFYKSCPTIFTQSFNRLFPEIKNRTSSQRFHPHSWIIVYNLSIGNSEVDAPKLDYIRENALHVFIVTRNVTDLFVREVLSGESVLFGSTDKHDVNAFEQTFRVHPLFRNDGVFSGVDRRNPFRISFFECPPYVMIGNGSQNESAEK